jgi:DNA repair protein RecO (recombination protein O)
MNLKVRALVLRRRAFGESDALLTLLSPDKGRFTALAKGVRKAKNRWSGGCDQFVLGRFLLYQRRSLPLIQQVEVERAFLGLRKSLPALVVATYLAELTGRITVEHDPQPELFQLLCEALDILEERKADPFLLRRFFELHALVFTGYEPELERCVRCGRSSNEEWTFSPSAGGVVCRQCQSEVSDTLPLSGGARTYLLRLRSTSPEQWKHLRLSEAAERQLERLFRDYLRYYFDIELHSAEFVRTVWEQERRAS